MLISIVYWQGGQFKGDLQAPVIILQPNRTEPNSRCGCFTTTRQGMTLAMYRYTMPRSRVTCLDGPTSACARSEMHRLRGRTVRHLQILTELAMRRHQISLCALLRSELSWQLALECLSRPLPCVKTEPEHRIVTKQVKLGLHLRVSDTDSNQPHDALGTRARKSVTAKSVTNCVS